MSQLLLLLLIVIFVSITFRVATLYGTDVPEPFSCGSDEVCYCEESKDCKRESKKEE